MPPRPAPDLTQRREEVRATTRAIAETEGWPAVTMRHVSERLGVTQPVLYSVFGSRQELVAAVALVGFVDLGDALHAAERTVRARVRAYLDFAASHPHTYEAMFSMPSDLHFGDQNTPEELRRAFSGIRDALPQGDDVRAEVLWSTLHGLATLWAGGRLRASQTSARLDVAVALFDNEPEG